MNIDATLIKIIIIVFPGIVAYSLFHNLKASRASYLWEAAIEIFIFSFIAYYVENLFNRILKHGFRFWIGEVIPNNINAILTNAEISWVELLYAIGVAVLLGLIFALFYNKKIITKIGQFLRITNKYGDEDVWEYLYNSPNIEWVHVRDFENGLIYLGYVKAFSNKPNTHELLLTDVDVFDNDNNKIDKLPAIYLPLSNNYVVEIPRLVGVNPLSLSYEEFEKIQTKIVFAEEKEVLSDMYLKNENKKNYTLKRLQSRKKHIQLQIILEKYKDMEEFNAQESK